MLKRWYWEGGLLHVSFDAETLGSHPDPQLVQQALAQAWVHAVRVEGLMQGEHSFERMIKEHHPFDNLKALTGVRSLDFSREGLEDSEITGLLRCPWFSGVSELNLANNNLTPHTIPLLCNSAMLERLTRIDLRNNDLYTDSFDAIVESPVAKRLRRLDMFINYYPFESSIRKRLEWQQERQASYRDRFVNTLGMEFVRIPAGTFLMGSAEDEPQRFPDEGPQHVVTISRPFYLGLYPVTQWQSETRPDRARLEASSCSGPPVSSMTIAFMRRSERSACSAPTRGARPPRRRATPRRTSLAATGALTSASARSVPGVAAR